MARTHGMAKVRGRRTPTYVTWQRMKARCLNPAAVDYDRYGARGIKVCDRWMQFESFLADMGTRPDGLQLDRIDNDGHYEPGNCRWVTKQHNARNRSSNRLLTIDGETKTATEWAQLKGLPPDRVLQRLARGDSPERALRP